MHTPKYFALSNLSSSEVRVITNPDKVAFTKLIPSDIRTKADRRVWANRPETKHCFISGYEAANPLLRVNPRQGNPAFKMHSLIVDYDAYAPSHGDAIELISREFAGDQELLPNWIVTTRSDARRLIWEFAEPLCLDAQKFHEHFIRVLKRELRLTKLLAGLDEPALCQPATYFEIGMDWAPVTKVPLSREFILNCFGEAVLESSKRHQNTGGLPEIPMERLYKEFESKFPGRLGMPEDMFVPGVRAAIAWIADAQNPTSCVYYPHGVYCYSTEKIFHSYREIFGDAFVRQFERDRTGTATENIFYFGNNQYCRVKEEADGSRQFIRQKKDEVKDYLKVVWGFSPKQASSGGGSELDRALQLVQELRTVNGMAPFLWNRDLLVTAHGEQFLNCSNVRPLPPSDEPAGKWGERFPWTADWLIHLFAPRTQLLRLLTWMRQSYKNALESTPRRNLALFLVGTTNLGKTLWNQTWWPHIMGGGAEATNFLLNGGGFNKALASSPHCYVDDARASSTERELQTFTETLKAFVANPQMEFHPKYVDAVSVPYNGTVCVTMNEDDLSLQMLPSLDRSVVDKVLILLCAAGGKETVFTRFAKEHGSDAVFSDALKREAPAFLRWLLSWEPPKSLTEGSMRFSTAAYVHPNLMHASVTNSSAGDLMAVIDLLMESDAFVAEEVKKEGFYDCTALQLLNVITANPLTHRLLGSFGNSARGVGQRLAKLAKLSSSRVVNLRLLRTKKNPIKQSKHKGDATVYRLLPP